MARGAHGCLIYRRKYRWSAVLDGVREEEGGESGVPLRGPMSS